MKLLIKTNNKKENIGISKPLIILYVIMTEKNNITCAFIIHNGRYIVYSVGVFLMEEIQLILAKNLKQFEKKKN